LIVADGQAEVGVVDGHTEDGAGEWPSVLVDVSDMSIEEVKSADNEMLARSLRRLADDLAAPGEPIAGFNSAL
jgi:FXSXX-COOH protein